MDKDDKNLLRFNNDKPTKESLLAYLVNHFENKIVERAMEKKDVAPLADAIIELKSGFDKLDLDYGDKKKPKKENNPSR